MPIAATDLVLYQSDSHPSDDVSTTGGVIDPLMRAEFTQFSATAKVSLTSSAADTRDVDIVFRTTDGALDTEQMTLDGTNEVLSVADVERLLSVIADSTNGSNTITVKQGTGGTTRGTIPPNELGFSACFIASASESSGVDRYEKLHWANNHATLTLTSADVTLTADPAARITVAVVVAKDDNTSIANRKAVPGGVSFVDDNVVTSVPTTTLEAGESIGVWVKQALQAADAPIKSTFTLRLRGASA